jgi:multidrug resistance protein, MATE family
MLFAHLDRERLRHEVRATLALATPLIFGQLSTMLMPFIDTVLAGHLSALTLAAVAIGSQIWSLVYVLLVGTLLALSPSIAQLNGAGRRAEIGPLFRQSLWLALALSLLAIVLMRNCEVLLRAIGVADEVVVPAMQFLLALSYGAPALALFFCLRGMSEGIGLTRPVLYFSVFGLALLVPVAYALMYGRWGMPALGARGSGIATALVLWAQAIAFVVYVHKRKHYADLQLFARFDGPQRSPIFALLKLGVPMGMTLLMEGGLFIATALLIGTLGAIASAGHQIALNVSSLAFMLPLGLALATTVRVGNAVGRGDREAVRYAGFVSLGLTLATQAFSAMLMLLLSEPIARLYSGDTAVVALAAQLLTLSAIFQFSDGIQVVANGALRGLKDSRVPMLLTFIAYWGVGMTLGYALGFHYGLGPRGLWMGLIAGLSMAALLLFWRFARLSRRGPQAPAISHL